MISGYLDQNILIYLSENDEWLKTVRAARESERFVPVLSPWHFYEIGKIPDDRRLALLTVVDQLRPAWMLDRADIQLVEFLHTWRDFWSGKHRSLNAIGSLVDVVSFLFRVPPERAERFTLEQITSIFARPGGTDILKSVFAEQRAIALANQKTLMSRVYTDRMDFEVQQHYLARLLGREHETEPSREQLDARTARIWKNPLTREQIRFFINFGGMSDLRAWQVESQLTRLHMVGTAILNENRQVDRQHACAGLAYCDLFATNDRELTNRSREITSKLKFKPAELVTPEDFIQRLQDLIS
jgi:hypothetical protein